MTFFDGTPLIIAVFSILCPKRNKKESKIGNSLVPKFVLHVIFYEINSVLHKSRKEKNSSLNSRDSVEGLYKYTPE